jgi:hypothetical protein
VRALAGLLVWAWASAAAAPASLQAQATPDLIDRVRAFAGQYQREAPSLVALEQYVQNLTTSRGGATQRELTSELVMVRLPGTAGWAMLRDVLTVDKHRLRDREERLMTLLQSPAATALSQAQAIAQESARFNLGRVTRTINVPDVALEFLQPRHAGRIRIDPPRKDVVDGVPVLVFRFRETTGPGIIRRTAGGDLLAGGRVWADAESGAIVRTELVVSDRSSRGTCTVDFRPDERLSIRVPVRMTERYVHPGETVDAVATYSDFRSFAVSTAEKLTKPPGW